MSIYDRIIKLLAEHTGKDASEFTPETTFESLGIDSLETVEMVMELEEELGVTLFDRGSRTIRLTDAGKLLYNRAQGILEKSKNLSSESSARIFSISSSESSKYFLTGIITKRDSF